MKNDFKKFLINILYKYRKIKIPTIPQTSKSSKKMCNVLLYVRSDSVEQNTRNPPKKTKEIHGKS